MIFARFARSAFDNRNYLYGLGPAGIVLTAALAILVAVLLVPL